MVEWAKAAGVDRNALDRALKGKSISTETIIRLCRAENMRMDWLMTDKGTPFYVTSFVSDAEMAEELLMHYGDCGDEWSLTVVADRDTLAPAAVILIMPAADETEKGLVTYSLLEILVGPIEELTWQVIVKPAWKATYQWLMTASALEALKAGQLGTYQLTAKVGILKVEDRLDYGLFHAKETDGCLQEESGRYINGLTELEKDFLMTVRQLPLIERRKWLVALKQWVAFGT